MIRFSEGELLDLLPSQMKNDVDMICLSYALKCGVERLLEYEMGTMTANFINRLPEKILDVLAVELRSPYYMDSMDIEIKRRIIQNTLIWHTKAGTASAVSEMIETVFGEGSVVEWPDFTEGEKTPYTFDIVTNARFTEDVYAVLLDIIERVKNERSHLRRILIDRWIYMYEYAGSGAIGKPKIYITDHPERTGRKMHDQEHAAAGAVGKPKITLTNNAADRSRQQAGREQAAAGAVSRPKIGIGNTMEKRQREASARGSAAAGAYSAPHEMIGNNTAPGSRSVQGAEKLAAAAVSRPFVRVGNTRGSSQASAEIKRYHAASAVSYPKTTIK